MAGFGFSVGDFITIGVLAGQVYLRCKASVVEFKDLSREVISMQIVLDAIQRFWTEEEARGHDLDIEHKRGLKELTENCQNVLQSIIELLDEHQALARGSRIARMRWIPIQINPIRTKLILFTTVLATLNSTITAKSQANSQAQVLRALNVIQRDLWEGKRRTSAVSRVTMDELCDDHSDAWQNINAEIESVGVDTASVTANQQFIRVWIDKVILEEAGEEDEAWRGGESPPWPASATPREEHVAVMALGSPDKDKADTEQTAVETLAQSAPASLSAEHLVRVPSFSSHRSKDSTWRPFNGPNRDYVQELLAKLFHSVDSIAMENTILLTKRIFHQLDWRNCGFLYRPTIEDEFRDAIHRAKMVLSDERILQLVSDGDKNRDGVIDREEFVELVNELLALFIKGEDDGLQESVAKDSGRGVEYCVREVTKIFADKPSQAILPWGWRLGSTEPTTFIFEYGSTTFMTSEVAPHVTLRSFRVAAFIAARLCVRMIVRALSVWGKELVKNPPHVFDEYQRPIDVVLKVASGFALFEKGKSPSRWDSQLDELQDLMSLVATVDSTGPNAEDATSLLGKISKLRDDTFNVLRLILGFVVALGQLPGTEWRESPPKIENWRRLRMQTRANHIREASRLVLNSQPLMDECQSWMNCNPSLSANALDGLHQAMTLKAAQINIIDDLQNEKQINQLKQGNKIQITIVSAQNLMQGDSNEVLKPKAEITMSNGSADCSSYRYCPESLEPSYPVWNYVSHWNVCTDSVLSIRINSNSSKWSSRTVLGVRRRGQNKFLGECTIRISNMVGDLSEPKCHEKTLDLVDRFGNTLPSGTVTIAIEPHPPKKIQSAQWAGTSIRDLMTSINEAPLPEGWQKMTTADGRTYFKNMADEKKTVAYNFDVLVEDELVIPTKNSSKIDQSDKQPATTPSVRARRRKHRFQAQSFQQYYVALP